LDIIDEEKTLFLKQFRPFKKAVQQTLWRNFVAYTVQRQLEFTFTSLSDGGRKDITLNEIFLSTKFQPDLHYIVDVALTLPVTTASVERAFSRLRLIKSHLRTTMSASRLQSLVRISANLHLTNQIPLSHLMEEFTKFERRVIFK
jgi:hypothetical protein